MAGMKSLLAGLLLLSFGGGLHGVDDNVDRFVYSGFTGASLSLDGTASVTPNGILELTNGTIHLTGHAIHPTPVRLRSSPGGAVRSFSASFVFGILTSYPELNLSGHGIVFFIGTNNLSTAKSGPYLGLLNDRNNGNTSNHVFGVELNTITTTEFRDPDNNHVGIDINSLHSVGVHAAGYYDHKTGAFRDLLLISGKAMQVWVDYDGESTQINVFLAPLEMANPARPLVSSMYNLSQVLLEPAFLGFSSSTGSFISCRHYVLGWSFAMDGPAPAIDMSKLPKLPEKVFSKRSLVLGITLSTAIIVFVIFVVSMVVFLVRRRIKRWSQEQEYPGGAYYDVEIPEDQE